MDKHIIENEMPKEQKEVIEKSLDDFDILQILEKYTDGFKAKAKSKKNQKIYCMQMINYKLVKDHNKINKLKEDIGNIRNFNNPHIIKYYHYFEENEKIYILYEFLDNDIKKYIEINSSIKKAIPESEIWDLLYQSLSGLTHIHNHFFIHNNIKPESLFLTDDKKLKIGNLDTIIFKMKENEFVQKETFIIGSPLYMSPEMLSQQPYTSKTDIYSLGCVFHKLCFFSEPRKPISAFKENGKIKFMNYKDIPPKSNINIYSNDLLELINQMIEKDQNKRPDSESIFNIVRKKYSSFKKQNSSIFCVYRCLFSFSDFYHKCKKHFTKNVDLIGNTPIIYSFLLFTEKVLGERNLLILNEIRDLLILSNPSFPDPGEIECIDLIEFIIKKLFFESNHNKKCKDIYFTDENKEHILDITKTNYYSNYSIYAKEFPSFVNDFFIGHFEFNRRCLSCGFSSGRTLYQNFYYTIINVNSAIKSGYNINDENFIYKCLQDKSKINITNICPYCKIITEQEEIKQISVYPKKLIIYIKYGNLGNMINIKYPLKMFLSTNQNDKNIISRKSYLFRLNSVIHENVLREPKEYGCGLIHNQNWYFFHDNEIIEYKDFRYKYIYGNVIMLFYQLDEKSDSNI